VAHDNPKSDSVLRIGIILAAGRGRRMGGTKQPMFDSIRAGLVAAREIDLQATVVLQPGDHPEVAVATLGVLVNCSLKRPVQAIIPEHDGRGGHPALIPPDVAALILEAQCPNGLAQFWLDHPESCLRIAVDDANILKDIDTPTDLPSN
jgi:molybdenum cofactor cytidylyltransferase